MGNGIVRAARVSKRLYGWHDQPLAYARGSQVRHTLEGPRDSRTGTARPQRLSPPADSNRRYSSLQQRCQLLVLNITSPALSSPTSPHITVALGHTSRSTSCDRPQRVCRAAHIVFRKHPEKNWVGFE